MRAHDVHPTSFPLPTLREEVANAITHGVGVLASAVGGTVLITLAVLSGDAWLIVGASVYVGSLVLLYTASTLYHAIPYQGAKARLQIFDHCAIYVLIAGTYTPFLLMNLRGGWGWSLFGVVWGLAAIGVVFKLFFTGRFVLASTLVYLGMGWLALVAIGPMRQVLPLDTLLWLLGGGLLYTVGTVFYLNRRMPYGHAVWHLFVLGGSGCHFAAVLLEVLRAT
ncbi:MAG: hemolysin III family protein [Rhodothermaceae bacterium]|nr:hemolysin III family protein [Rhodothermaceae bacterium]